MRIVLADDQPKVLFALNALLARNPELMVVGEAKNAEELIEQVIEIKPDMIILDWLLPGLEEIGSIGALRKHLPRLYVIALSGRPELRQSALNSGANAFISKIDPPEGLLKTIARCQKKVDGLQPSTN